jgi:hypothetical protein
MMIVLEHDPQLGGFPPPDPGPDGIGSDVWGNEWPLGGDVDRRMPEPFTVEPDHPMDVGNLDAMPPGPALASRLAAALPEDLGDAELVGVIAAAEGLARWSTALQMRAMAELSRRPVFLPDRARDEDAELRSAGAQVAAELQLAQVTAEKRVWTARQLIERFPATFDAILVGKIDARRAELIAEVASRHGFRVAEVVEARVLPRRDRARSASIGELSNARFCSRTQQTRSSDTRRRRPVAGCGSRRCPTGWAKWWRI